MSGYRELEHDVIVIGAGGAGLRAAIEAAAEGVRVGLICKSLLGKAHTVMAEGGMAAALANVDERDGWKVHFADTMRGGQYLNSWRMAEIHAKESPDRARELEKWGALFDRTPDGRILQRNFGGHAYPRLAHVGDRTGLEMIRTLQDHGIHQGIDVHMEHTVITLLQDDTRVVGAVAYDRDRGRFRHWVRTIAENKIRQNARRAQLPVASDADVSVCADDAPSLEDIWDREWQLQDILWCLDQASEDISPRRMEAFRLYTIDGLPPSEVAERLNMTVGHVYVVRHLVLNMIRKRIKKLDDAE